MNLIDDIIDFFMPRRCVFCGRIIHGTNAFICPTCALHLPLAMPQDATDNELARLYWHRLPVERALYMLQYHPTDKSVQLIIGPKFAHREDIAIGVGKLLATHLPKDFFDGIDAIVPMPSSTSRLRRRGMNHIEVAARSMMDELGLPIVIEGDAVRRTGYGRSQIGLKKRERLDNVDPSQFTVVKPEQLDGRHILIMDDVITSGASTYALAKAIHNACPAARFSFLAVSRPHA